MRHFHGLKAGFQYRGGTQKQESVLLVRLWNLQLGQTGQGLVEELDFDLLPLNNLLICNYGDDTCTHSNYKSDAFGIKSNSPPRPLPGSHAGSLCLAWSAPQPLQPYLVLCFPCPCPACIELLEQAQPHVICACCSLWPECFSHILLLSQLLLNHQVSAELSNLQDAFLPSLPV